VGTRVSRASAGAAVTRGIGVPGWRQWGVHAGDAVLLAKEMRTIPDGLGVDCIMCRDGDDVLERWLPHRDRRR